MTQSPNISLSISLKTKQKALRKWRKNETDSDKTSNSSMLHLITSYLFNGFIALRPNNGYGNRNSLRCARLLSKPKGHVLLGERFQMISKPGSLPGSIAIIMPIVAPAKQLSKKRKDTTDIVFTIK